jgi:hypothetical protein
MNNQVDGVTLGAGAQLNEADRANISLRYVIHVDRDTSPLPTATVPTEAIARCADGTSM